MDTISAAPVTTWVEQEPDGFRPAGRNGHSAVQMGTKMVVFGGAEGAVRTNETASFDVSTQKWSMLPVRGQLPAARSYHVAWVYGSEMYVHGGESGEGRTDGGVKGDDGKSEDDSPSSPSRPASASRTTSSRIASRHCFDDVHAFNLGPRNTESVFLFGGITAGAGEANNDLFRLDLVKLGTWQCMWLKVAVRGPAPSPRSGHTATAISDTKMAVFGGACGASFFSDLHILDMRKNLWTRIVTGGVPPTPRHGHCAPLVGREGGSTSPLLVVFGGIESVNNQQHFPKDLFLLDLVSNVWSRAKVGHSFPSPRYGHTLVRVPTHGDVADADISLRHAAANSKLLLFGGLNAMYCPGDLWSLSLVHRSLHSVEELINHELQSRRAEMARTVPGVEFEALDELDRLQATARTTDTNGDGAEPDSGLAEEVGVGILELKKRLNVTEKMLLREQAARRQLARERDELKALLKTATSQLASQRASHLEAMSQTKAKGERQVEEARASERQARADLRRAVQMLCLHDLASQMRMEVWQRRHTNRNVIAESQMVAGASGWDPSAVGEGGGVEAAATAANYDGWSSTNGAGAEAGGITGARRLPPVRVPQGGSHHAPDDHRGRMSPIQHSGTRNDFPDSSDKRRPSYIAGDDDSVYTDGSPRL